MTRSNPHGPILDPHPDLARLERDQRREARSQRAHEVLNPLAEMAEARPIGEYDEPNTRDVRLGIIPPTIANPNFEIKSSMLNLVERSTYKGHSSECPLEHLERFERLVGRTLKINGVPEDTMKMILFPFSLEDKAAYWERNVPSDKVSTWPTVKTEFLRQFFPKQKTARFRIDIQSFKQKGLESLSEAWDRLQGLTRSCPHHGVSKENILGIFYRGANTDVRKALDTASNGNFSSLTCDQAETLITNLAQSDAYSSGDFDRSVKTVVSNPSDSKIQELNDKIEKLSRMLVNGQKHVSFVDDFSREVYYENCETGQNTQPMETIEDCSYVNYNKPFNQSHPNLSYRSTNVENPQDQVYPNSQPNNQAPRPQGHNFHGNQGQFPRSSNYPSNDSTAILFSIRDDIAKLRLAQFEHQAATQKVLAEHSARMDRFEAHISPPSSSKQPVASFPSKPEPNPKAPCNVISSITLYRDDDSDDDLHLIRADGTDPLPSLELPSDDDLNVRWVDADEDEEMEPRWVDDEEEDPEEDPEELPEEELELVTEEDEESEDEPRNMDLSQTSETEDEADYLSENAWIDTLGTLSAPPTLDAKALAAEGAHTSPPWRTLEKLEGAGKFMIPCSLNGSFVSNALCDTGAFTNVISLAMVQRFGWSDMEPNSTPLTFGDASRRNAVGIIRDCSVLIDHTIIPTDFLVVDMVDSTEQPVVLGSPFLTTVGARLDYAARTVVLLNVNPDRYFFIRHRPHDRISTIGLSPPSIDASLPIESSHFLETLVLDDDKPPPLVASSMVLALDDVENPKNASPLPAPNRQRPKKKPHNRPPKPPLTLKPLYLSNGKLECKVICKGANKPFHTARILFPTDRGPHDAATISEKMALAFGIAATDRGPYHEDPRQLSN